MNKRILIVDDEPLIRTALSAAFREDNTLVTAVSCGSDALEEIDQNRFDLCFIDIHLPDMNGLNIMKAVKTVSPGTKIVIMTGSEVDDDMLKFIRQHADLLMSKPFDLDRIKTFTSRVFAPVFPAGDHADKTKGGAFENWLEEDQRQHKRYATAHAISCVGAAESDQEENRFPASVIDISAAGMGIRADCSLEPGRVIGFSGSSILGMGIVQWSMSAETGSSCRAGLRFVEPEHAPRARQQGVD